MRSGITVYGHAADRDEPALVQVFQFYGGELQSTLFPATDVQPLLDALKAAAEGALNGQGFKVELEVGKED